MSEKEGYVEVKVKVPKRFMRLLESQKYFGKTKNSFLTNAVIRAVHCELNMLDTHEQDRIEREFRIEPKLVVDLSERIH